MIAKSFSCLFQLHFQQTCHQLAKHDIVLHTLQVTAEMSEVVLDNILDQVCHVLGIINISGGYQVLPPGFYLYDVLPLHVQVCRRKAYQKPTRIKQLTKHYKP